MNILTQFPDMEEHILELIEQEEKIQQNHKFITENFKNEDFKNYIKDTSK